VARKKDAPLAEYEKKRDFATTPEPAPERPARTRRRKPRFVVQEHHARALHWDLRLEHDGVLWSWAVPKGIPMLQKPNHLAVRTEDHPLKYLTFHGDIPTGQYGAGTMTVWDSGTFDAEKMLDDEVIVTFAGDRVRGKYVLFRTRGDQWMIHRMSPPDDPTRTAVPTGLQPMLAVASVHLPPDDEHYAYEMKWDGMRAIVTVDGGRVGLTTRLGNDATSRFPELHALGEALGAIDAVLDGEIVALDAEGRPSFEQLQPRMHVSSASAARRLAHERPAVLMLFDVLWLDGHSVLELAYTERRRLLEQLALAGPAWQTPPTTYGPGGKDVLDTAQSLGLEGVVAKRLDSTYQPGRRSDAWRKVKPVQAQELVVGGWLPGTGRLDGRLGSVLVGYYDGDSDLRYAGRVGSGLDEQKRAELEERLAPLTRADPPFVKVPKLPRPVWVEPEVVVNVGFHEWTTAGVLRAPRYRGLRDDKPAADVVRELP
jgi:bifunctional non-homologous end joining protein LigD